MTLAYDRRLHLAAGAAITLAVGLASGSVSLGFLLGALAGLGKEVVWDYLLDKGDPDGIDFGLTVVGACGGAVAALGILALS